VFYQHKLEPASNIIGLDSPAQSWTPITDTTIPEDTRTAAFAQWVSGYFDHGEVSRRNLSQLSWIVPSPTRAPTIFNFHSAYAAIVEGGSNVAPDLLSVVNFLPQLKVNYHNAAYNDTVRNLLPQMKVRYLAGTRSPAFAYATLWQVEDENAARGQYISFSLIKGANHLVRLEEL
jgi:hypothetical protein